MQGSAAGHLAENLCDGAWEWTLSRDIETWLRLPVQDEQQFWCPRVGDMLTAWAADLELGRPG